MKLIWSARAWNDLIEIGEFIAQSAPENARRFVQLLLDRAKQSSQFPLSGRIVPEYQEENLRELIEGSYRIVYEIDAKKKTITVVAVFEGRKKIRKGDE